MRVMVIVKANEASERGEMPSQELLEAMTTFNEELVKAGLMLAGDGLKPSSNGVRVHFSGKDRTVTDGPFAETKELIAGFWMWKVKSMAEAVAWVKLPQPPQRPERHRDPPRLRDGGLRRCHDARAARPRVPPARRRAQERGRVRE